MENLDKTRQFLFLFPFFVLKTEPTANFSTFVCLNSVCFCKIPHWVVKSRHSILTILKQSKMEVPENQSW